nr:hypothetical protein JVH1_4702 [Rhodococcus sp. JVH1]
MSGRWGAAALVLPLHAADLTDWGVFWLWGTSDAYGLRW